MNTSKSMFFYIFFIYFLRSGSRKVKSMDVCAEGISNGKFNLFTSFIYSLSVDMDHFINDHDLKYEKVITLPDKKN